MGLFGNVDTCIEPVLEVSEVPEHPQLRARGLLVELPTREGLIATIGQPLKLRGVGVGEDRRAPGPGEHSMEIMQRLGYQDREIEALVTAGVVG